METDYILRPPSQFSKSTKDYIESYRKDNGNIRLFYINTSMQQITSMEFEDISQLPDATALLELDKERIADFVESLNVNLNTKWYFYILLENIMDRAINYSTDYWHKAYVKKIEFIPTLEIEQNVFRITLGHLKKSVAANFIGSPYRRKVPLIYDNQGRVLFPLKNIEATGFGIMDILREMGPIDRERFLNTPCKGSTSLNQSKVSILFWLKNKNTDRIKFVIPTIFGTPDPFYFNRMAILNERRELTFQLHIDDFILEPLETEMQACVTKLYVNSSYFEEASMYMRETHWGLAELAKVEPHRHHRTMPQRIAVKTAFFNRYKKKLKEFEGIYWDRSFNGHLQRSGDDIVQDILHAKYYGISLEKEHADFYKEDLKQNIGGLICIFEDFIKWREKNPDLVKKINDRYANTLEGKLLYSPENILQKLYEVILWLGFSIDEVKLKGKEFVKNNKTRGDVSSPNVPADVVYNKEKQNLFDIRNITGRRAENSI